MNQSSTQTEASPALKISRIVLALGLCLAATAVAEENIDNHQQQISPPDNWYQVEVILFTHQGDSGSEAPPLNYQLAFPPNWQELIDPRLEQNGAPLPIAEGALLSADRLNGVEPPSRFIPRAQVEDPAISQFQDQDSPQQDISQEIPSDARTQAAQRLAEAQAMDQQLAEASAYQPRYEQPLLMLDSQFRDLNESALTLDRRGYNLVFHSAWRFASEGEETDPWLLIRAGQQLEDRHQIEGSLRFYKSRFLHFQTDLWLSQFSLDSTQLVELPELPKAPEPEQASAPQSVDFHSSPANLGPVDLDSFQDLDNPASLAGPASRQLLELTDRETAAPKQYPVAQLWTLKKSLRLDEDEVYYIDHPKMGILVSIKSYQPLLLNPQQSAEIDEPVAE